MTSLHRAPSLQNVPTVAGSGDPGDVERFAGLGTEARFTTPQTFFEIMRTQAETWIPVIRAAKLKLE